MPRGPDVVCIVVDDLGWRDLGCTGSDFHQTPHLDALAARGTRFTQAYAAAPNCSPTRASLLTGRYPARVGLTQIVGGHSVGRLLDVPSFAQLPRQEYTYARAFRAGGYRTWHVGKWHLGPPHSWPDRHGFEVNIGGCDAGHPRSWWPPYRLPTLSDGPPGEYLTDRLTDEAIGLVEGAVADRASGVDDRPFLLNLWHYAVHTPLEAPAELVAEQRRRAEARGLIETDQVGDAGPMPYWNSGGQRMRRRSAQGNPAYAAMIANLDANVGRLLARLAELGLAEDTVVIVTSDNGGLHVNAASTCNLPLADGKGWLSEGGVRVPLIIDDPRRRRPDGHGTVVDTPFISPDLYPTLLELAGLPARPDQHVDGISRAGHVGVAAEVDVASADEVRPLFWHFPHYAYVGSHPASAVRSGRWKLIRSYEHDSERLYDLVADPGETTDLAGRRPEERERLAGSLDGWLTELGAALPRPNPTAPFDEWIRGAAEPAPDVPT